MLFKPKNRSIEFRLINVDSEEFAEMKKLIEENGGVVCENSRFIFTNHKTYIGNEDVFDIDYIRECVRVGQLLELIDFKIGKKGLLGCLMNFFVTGNRYCSCGTTSYSNHCPMHMSGDIELAIIPDIDHNYVHRGCGEESQSKEKDNQISSDIYMSPSTEEMGGTQFSDSIFNPDNSLSTTCTQLQFDDVGQNVTNSNFAIENNEANGEYLTAGNSNVPMFSSELRIVAEKDSNNINEIFPLSAAEEEAYDESLEERNNLRSITQDTDTDTSPSERSNKVQILSSTLLSASEIVKLCPKKVRRRRSRSKGAEEKAVAGPSKVGDTVTLLGDSSNRTNLSHSGIFHSLKDVTSFRTSSSDSDETICERFSPRERKCRDSAEMIGKVRCMKFSLDVITNSENKCPNEEQPGPSRITHITISSGNEQNTSDSVISLQSEPESPKKQKKRSHTSWMQQNYSKVSNDEKNTVVSSTRVIDSSFISEDSSESDTGITNPRTRVSLHDTTIDNQNNRLKSVTKKNRVLLSRNYSLWEQKEMVQYLIRTNSISQAKGNQIWKQMIDDGYLEHRTFQSLNNHFRRQILPNIRRFNMDSKLRAKFEKLLL